MLNKILCIFLLFTLSAHAQEALSPYVFANSEEETRFYDLTAQLRCLVCQNQTLLDSDAPLAKNLRELVFDQVRMGQSNEEIIAYLTARYGDFILYQPPLNRSTSLLWFGPIILLLLAAGSLAVIIRRAHQQHQGEK